MTTKHRHAPFLAIFLVATGLLAAAPSHAASTIAHADGSSTAALADPVAVLAESDFDRATKALLLELIEEARTSTGDRDRFLATTEAITREAVEATEDASYAQLENFLTAYHASLSLETKFEWDIKPHAAKKCNDNFDCVLAVSVCVIITWQDGNGSGGINCISRALL